VQLSGKAPCMRLCVDPNAAKRKKKEENEGFFKANGS
jgi:hypothetical protein